MQFIQGSNRHQSYFATLDDQVSADNPVRLIDAFIDKLELERLGFTKTVHKSEGRPPYAPGALLKLYLYGYLNKIRSSHKLEKECIRNRELQWLLQRPLIGCISLSFVSRLLFVGRVFNVCKFYFINFRLFVTE